MARELVKKFKDGWHYRLGSGSEYDWVGPFETKHVAEQVREGVTGGAWGYPRHQRDTPAHAAVRSNKAGTWEVEAGRGLTYDHHDGRGPLLMFNLHRVVNPRTSGSHIRPDELDEITHEIARFLNSKKRKVTPTDY